ncbi:DnaB-like helicase C-terminal domain-containing protein [bacterium]|nr:DnaB-like helicase C-terminal domain-containing protein [bacterium]
MQLEQTILRNLLTNDEYARKVAAFLTPEYFEGVYKGLFKEFTKFIAKYNKLPTMEALKIEIDEGDRLSDEHYRHAMEILPNIFTPEMENLEWLIDRTEKWCQDRAVYNAIMESIQVIDGKHQTLTKNALPDILSKALGVTFDTNIGHDYLENVDERFDFYHLQEERIPFDLDMFNQITKGGLPNKTLNIALAGTGVGKSLFMCHCAGANLEQGRNVLYITMEMAEERIAERIDANLMNVAIDQLENLSKDMFVDKANKIRKKTQGKLVIKEYPTGGANASHFRALLNELKLKKNFVPDMIYIDYLNICSSARMKAMGGAINSYTYIKSIAEELRGLAVEMNVPIVSATQTTRGGYNNDDVGLEDTSESFGLPATADLMFALISNEELSNNRQILVKQLKNRYNDPVANGRFVVGVDRSKMRLYDVDQNTNPMNREEDTGPAFDNSASGQRLSQENRFGDFKL